MLKLQKVHDLLRIKEMIQAYMYLHSCRTQVFNFTGTLKLIVYASLTHIFNLVISTGIIPNRTGRVLEPLGSEVAVSIQMI